MKKVEQLRRFAEEHAFSLAMFFSAGMAAGILLFVAIVVIVDMGL